MPSAAIHLRSLTYYWRSGLATLFGVVAATTALTGALLVGDSMRGSLRALAVGRLGHVEFALVGPRFFREDLGRQLSGSEGFGDRYGTVTPAVFLRGSASHADSNARVNRVNVLGVQPEFWTLDSVRHSHPDKAVTGRSVILNAALARELGAEVGHDVLIRFASQSEVSAETLLGRRDRRTESLRLTVRAIVPGERLGGLDLNPTQVEPFNAFVPLATVQRAVKRRARVNGLLVGAAASAKKPGGAAHLQAQLAGHVQLEDLGLKLLVDQDRGIVSLESESSLIGPVVEPVALQAAEAVDASAAAVLTYLANSIVLESSEPKGADTKPAEPNVIPYSTVTALDLSSPIVRSSLKLTDGAPAPDLGKDEILLNTWAAEDLGATVGDRVRLSYYVTGSFGRLDTESASFTVHGIVAMSGLGNDPHLTPTYEGITDADDVAAWDPPFPVDLRRVREKDEDYWDEYRAAPKAFIPMDTGLALWATHGERFGRLTSIRIRSRASSESKEDAESLAEKFKAEILKRLDPDRVGLTFEAVRERALAAGAGSTDFGMLFVGFSFFVIVSAAMLVALMFRLGVEQRAGEVGILLATGYRPGTVSRLMLAEGLVLSGIGSLLGLGGALGYAWLMLAGLRTWWSAAVNAPFLGLYVSPTSLIIGGVAGVLIALISIAWALRGLVRQPVRGLLSGDTTSGTFLQNGRRKGYAGVVAASGLAIAVLLAAAALLSDAISAAGVFFGSGAAMLVAALAWLTARIRAARPAEILGLRGADLARLGFRNVGRNPRRTLLTTGLIASATFLIVAVGANRHEAGDDLLEKSSGTGGFALLAESAVPLIHDLNTADGQRDLALSEQTRAALAGAQVMPFRLRPGDESSCLNLYQVRDPRILGATKAMMQRGGFRFGSTLAETDEEKENPWTLLNRSFPDGAIPAIGDTNTVMWLLHLGLGKDLVMTDESGTERRLRFVALLSGSVLQGELVVAEERFVRLFPSIDGYGFFLIESEPDQESALQRALEADLGDYGFDATSTADRLNAYLSVENTYLSTFQTLGGLGLILGTLGLSAVLLRNVWERRAELALLRALGYRRSVLGWMVLTENAAMLLFGVVAGVVSALVAVAPHALDRPDLIPWSSLALTMLGVLIVGLLAGAVALVPMLRSPLLPALRSE